MAQRSSQAFGQRPKKLRGARGEPGAAKLFEGDAEKPRTNAGLAALDVQRALDAAAPGMPRAEPIRLRFAEQRPHDALGRAPVGYRLAVKHPERITAIVVQNGNAYDEGLENDFWKPIKAYWKEPNNKEKRDAIRGLVTTKPPSGNTHTG